MVSDNKKSSIGGRTASDPHNLLEKVLNNRTKYNMLCENSQICTVLTIVDGLFAWSGGMALSGGSQRREPRKAKIEKNEKLNVTEIC